MDASVNRIPSSKDERAYCISLRSHHQHVSDVEYSLNELKMLIKTAGGIIAGSRIVRRDSLDPAYIVGKGYLEKLKEIIQDNEIKLLVFDLNNLKPAQVRNLEEVLKCRVIGRTEVILDIFARRARSSEAKIQVELAQLKYILPRLKGLGGVLSRLGGGIGTRGPGEKMLETDRRHIQKRISKLNNKLSAIASHRQLIRKNRSSEVLGAVVGYTNAGKSTLINRLAKDDLFVENRLFATLDAFTREVYIAPGNKVLLTDTVGFIRNLPVNLIESFKSTLEEIKNADFLIHVIDINSPDIDETIATVEKELVKLECNGKPVINFFNKADLLKSDELLHGISQKYNESITGSVYTGLGIDELMESISEIRNTLSHNQKSKMLM
ncbi:MAG TPA: GTPase HflX [Spirochaetota bacterium]|nr:GTPase HflX [Spirochaetota bacterium]